jgi:hypothetical protein
MTDVTGSDIRLGGESLGKNQFGLRPWNIQKLHNAIWKRQNILMGLNQYVS